MEYRRAREHTSQKICLRFFKGFVELIELKMWKPISWRNSTENALFEGLFSPFYMIYRIYSMKYNGLKIGEILQKPVNLCLSFA